MATVGLGLTIIYQFVTQDFGGQVRCENTEPNGVRITVEFPVLLDSNQEDIA
jgi:signal transduction histidine kinase